MMTLDCFAAVLLCDSTCTLRLRIQDRDVVRVSNGFIHDYGRNGYRDVKMYVILEEHVCEIQLHLRSFYSVKKGQHEVYRWSRTLNVTADMEADQLFKDMEPGSLALMTQLATENWCSTGRALAPLLHVSGRYADARDLLLQVNMHSERRELLRVPPMSSSEYEDVIRCDAGGGTCSHSVWRLLNLLRPCADAGTWSH